MVHIHPLCGIGEIEVGDDLAAVLVDAMHANGLEPKLFDVLVVTQKIVSKVEGRHARLTSDPPSQRAVELARITGKDPGLIDLVLAESTAIVRAAPGVLISRHHSGHVMANAGIDRSNLGPGEPDRVLLLPKDADASAGRLRARMMEIAGVAPAVLISDSFGRPWRMGVVNVAIGAAGLPSLIDHRGQSDRDGRPLESTEVALGDAIAAAAGLVTGEAAESVPAVLVRGLTWNAPECPAGHLVRPERMDLFR